MLSVRWEKTYLQLVRGADAKLCRCKLVHMNGSAESRSRGVLDVEHR